MSNQKFSRLVCIHARPIAHPTQDNDQGEPMKKALTLASLAALAAGVITTATVAATSDTGANAEATLRLADGTDIGSADFRDQDGAIEVHVALQVPAAATAVSSFHGFHVHANDDPANGDGCQADPAAEPSEWFVSADGHLKQEGQLHGGHDGDMAPLFLDSNGSAEATFTIEGSRRRAGRSCSDRPRWPGQLGQRPCRQRAQPVQPQQSRRSGPHPGHRKCWRPGRLRRDHR